MVQYGFHWGLVFRCNYPNIFIIAIENYCVSLYFLWSLDISLMDFYLFVSISSGEEVVERSIN